jgi:CRP-like cAMP-binding protein
MYDLLRKHFGKYVTLTKEEFERAADYFKFRKYKKHQYILQEGDVSRYETFILKGCTRIFETDGKGQEHIIQFGLEDWWVGDMYSYFTNSPSRLSIDCIEDCEVLQITADNFEKMCDEIPKLEKHFRKLFQSAFVASSQRIYSNLSKPAIERYKEFLDKYPLIGQRVPNSYIASYLGITPQSLSRLRARRTP